MIFEIVFFFIGFCDHRDLHSFPTRRSSDLIRFGIGRFNTEAEVDYVANRLIEVVSKDRKSTRLNSSHLGISYAVFCLKKKKSATGAPERDASLTVIATLTRHDYTSPAFCRP